MLLIIGAEVRVSDDFLIATSKKVKNKIKIKIKLIHVMNIVQLLR